MVPMYDSMVNTTEWMKMNVYQLKDTRLEGRNCTAIDGGGT